MLSTNLQKSVCWSVSALVHAIADTLKSRFSSITVRGEISNFSQATSGHCYFTLKDKTSQIRCVMFQRAASMLSFSPEHGDEVEVQGRLAIYEQRGDLQLIAETMHPVGQGHLLEQFQRLKTELENEGLFNLQRKRPIPTYPAHIGVISSLQAAALHDILIALKRRAPHVRITIYPSAVQGKQAAPEIARAIHQASLRNEANTLLICRGGGSLEDLWAFNEEVVVRAIAACPIPTITGIGHETDFTLADFAADLRAPTPTAAAELAAQPQTDLLKKLQKHTLQLKRYVHMQLDQQGQYIDHTSLRMQRPTAFIHQQQQRLEKNAQRLHASVQSTLVYQEQHINYITQRWPQISQHLLQKNEVHLNHLFIRWQQQAPVKPIQNQYQQIDQLVLRIQRQTRHELRQCHNHLQHTTQSLTQACNARIHLMQQQLEKLQLRLQALNPCSILSRGYAWITDEHGQVLSSAHQLNPGQNIYTQFADGNASATVKHVKPELLKRT